MAFTINIGTKSWSFIDNQHLIPVNGFINPELNKCGHSDPSNPPNSCSSLGSVDFQNTLNSQRSKAIEVVDAATKMAFDDENYADAISALKSLRAYYNGIHNTALQRKMWINSMIGRAKKDRCCQKPSSLVDYYDTAKAIEQSSWQVGLAIGQDIKALETAEEAFYDSTISQLEAQEIRAQVNYQIAQSNQEIAKEGFVTSQLSLMEGSGKIVYVVMALVAAFFVYRFVIKR